MRTSPCVALASLFLAGCHSSGPRSTMSPDYAEERGLDRETVLLSSWRPTPPQKCVVSRYPEALPTPDQLISIADMPILLEQGGIAVSRGSALVSMKFDSTGRVQRVRVIEGTVASDVGHVLEKVVLSAIEPQLPGREWAVRLRIDLDSVPRYRVGRSERCAAVPGPVTPHVSDTPSLAGPVGSPVVVPGKRSFSLKLLVAVNAAGTVVDVKPTSGAAQDASLFDSLRDHLVRQRWLPELDDRVPVETVVERTEHIQMVVVGRSY